jgi:3-methylcrotonyl-CoA carboxylase beta subunit
MSDPSTKAHNEVEPAPMKEFMKAEIEKQSNAFFATGQLWDDGIIDPADTRRVLGLGLSASMNAPAEETKFGIFRM